GSPTGATGQETTMQRLLRERGVTPIDVREARVWHYVPRQRCSPNWALHRKYKVGLEDGLRARKATDWHALMKAIHQGTRGALSLAKRTLLRDPVGQFSARMVLWRQAGFIKSYVFHQ